MNEHPAIPSLVLIPGKSDFDYSALYAIAIAYAHSGLLISEQGKAIDRPEFSFPAIVCSSFAIELFLKFFVAFERAERGDVSAIGKTHGLPDLWKKISPKNQEIIAGMYRNSSREPSFSAPELRIEIFLAALNGIGAAPFVKWRYAHELEDVTFMSHASISEVVDALGKAAEYRMKQRFAEGGAEKAATQVSSIADQDVERAEHPATHAEHDELAHRVAGNIVLIEGEESILLGRESPLRRIPANLEPKQALFLDGIRHTVEFLDITYGRLREVLTRLANNPPASCEIPDRFAHILLDAWTFVYAVSRFRTLYLQLPGIKFGEKKEGVPTLTELTQPFQNLRRFSDQLAQRSDKVASQSGGASGELSWLTGVQLQPEILAWHCTLRPGSLQLVPSAGNEPITSTLAWPTDGIRLSAGGYSGDLSNIRKHISVRVRSLEAELEQAFQQPDQAQVPVINDMFLRRPVKVLKD
jgi:hypothetical protein